MTTFIILFEDNPDADLDIRKKHMSAHLAFLEAHADAISAAGPLSSPTGAGQGGLWIVAAETEDKVEQLVHRDPFWDTGLRQSYRILRWRQVFANGIRQIT
ncbi:YciI family protein [Ruegeria sp. 2205SS24-7]|uniref:YciI family protein n=1 Tax=Ruegeria discodermiae TaxID=3064389 RepID=UPI0027406CDB|nr:YciI family protein [Ruegeria sp. 2205SS24-7]MDP5217913.1 YciI family protein [Ruegeria sp. 2205SS24-7]